MSIIILTFMGIMPIFLF